MGDRVTERTTASQAYAHAEAAHAKMTAHEDLCASRYEVIAQTLAELKADSKDQRKLLFGLLLSVAGGAIVTLVAVVLKAANLS